MSDLFWQSFWTNLPTLVLAFGTFVGIIISNRRLTTIHTAVNSKMDKMLELTASSSKAEGVKEEKERTI